MRKLPFVCLLRILSVILLCGCGQTFTYTFYSFQSYSVWKFLNSFT